MDPSSSMSMAHSRQKRVLPSRSRRGGPGVGSCDADVMILETQRRKFENEPLIPTDTPFLLTTNASIALASSDTSRLAINTFANERYFDRPEVLKSYREQLDIQTPEFVNISETHVGSRFRLRGIEEGITDTSDAAYEKRHRKYETFEKRQRLREKEKLKHEQYKLKERIDQLRAMDSSAFLALPASSFSAPPPFIEGEDLSSGANVNGNAAYSEGERRRKEMLDIALMLEERYRILLPPDRVRKPTALRTESLSLEPEVTTTTAKPRRPKEDDLISELDQRALVESSQHENSKIMIKLKVPPRTNSDTAHVPSPTVKTAATKKPKSSLPPSKHVAAPRKIRGRPTTPPVPIQPSFEKPPSPTPVLASAEPENHSYTDEDNTLDMEPETPATVIERDEERIAGPPVEIYSSPAQAGKLLSDEERKTPELQSPSYSFTEVVPPAPEPPSPPPEDIHSGYSAADLDQESESIAATVDHTLATEQVEVVRKPRGRRPKRPRLSSPVTQNNDESISMGPTYRRSVSRAPSTYSSHKQPIHGAIVTAALRNASGGPRTTAKAPRHNTAFGVKLHLTTKDTVVDFELPPWILSYEEAARRLGDDVYPVALPPAMRPSADELKSPNHLQKDGDLFCKAVPFSAEQNGVAVEPATKSEGSLEVPPSLSAEVTASSADPAAMLLDNSQEVQ